MSRKAGLPSSIRLRHFDEEVHFVEELGGREGPSIGRMVSIDEIEPNPHQPRQQMGDLTELTASIREKGIIQPLVVRRLGEKFQIISGERRYQAAMQAGLTELPCVERDADDRETVEIALVENIQRKDLTPFEEAEALGHLASSYGYTHESLATRLGKSRSSITEMLTLNSMPDEVRNLCRLADIHSKSLLLQVVRQETPEKMLALVERISKEGLSRDEARRAVRAPSRGRPENFTFKYGPKGSPFRLHLTFRKPRVEKHEVIRVLRRILSELESS
ncbi:MAG: ParB/RepB/Spo0J family partition protein [Vicinamibacteria bacterium]